MDLGYPMWSNIYYRKKRLRKNLNKIAKNELSRRETLIDYGCGKKPYKEIFTPYVDEYIGVDVEDGENVDLVISDDGKTSLEGGVADIVLSTQVLEHVPDPKQYLSEARRLLKGNGILILSTHGHFFYHPVPEDYWRWTHEGLRKEVGRAGFRIETLRGVVGKAATGAQFILDSVRPTLPGLLNAPFNFIMQWVIRFFDSKIFNQNRDKDASIFLVVARKKS
jgi:SAM-dependent methyltransferase